nr:hypothetical protein A4A49_63750 [Ipomoea batatas]
MADDYARIHLPGGQAIVIGPQEQGTTIVFSAAFAVILQFLQLKYQGQNQMGPFQAYPETMHFAVASFLMFFLLYGIHKRFCSHPLYRRASAHVFIPTAMAFFALFSLLSTASILFPESVRGAFYILCVFLSAGDWLHSLYTKIKNQLRDTSFIGDNNMMRLPV